MESQINRMLSEEDSRLFEVAKRAQVSRNMTIQVIDYADCNRILAGAFVRVLLEVPARNESYMVARILGTTYGESYNGFSNVPSQATNLYLVLELPPPLAAINGVQFQLNSVSNSGMGEGEFRSWLDTTRSEPALRVPSEQELVEVGLRLRPYEILRHRPTTNMSSAVFPSMPASGRTNVGRDGHSTQPTDSSAPPRSSSASGVSYLYPTGVPVHLQPGAVQLPPLDNRPGYPVSEDRAPLRNSGMGGEGGSTGVVGNGELCGAPHYAGGAPPMRPASSSTRDGFRAAYEDAPASRNRSSVVEETAGGGLHGSMGDTQSLRGTSASQDHSIQPAPTAAVQRFMGSTHEPKVESEDEEMERRLRQDVMNHLAQECVLFPKDARGYTLSRLRLLERDMIEYLQHVRDEIQGKQENCIVCMDHVPTVIILPCKHKVMCRLCAPSCATCPVCRSKIAEMFEPEEV